MKLPKFLRILVIFLFVVIVLLPILAMLVVPSGSSNVALAPFQFDQRHLILAQNSLLLAAATTLFAVMIGVPFAFLCQRTLFFGRRLFTILYLTPLLIPPYIQAIAWTRAWSWFGNYLPFDIYNIYGAILVLTLCYFPFVTLMTLTGLKSIDRPMEESSLLHHGAFRTLTGVSLPLCLPHICCGALFVFIFAIIDFGVPDIFRLKVYPIEIFIQFSAFYDDKSAALLSYPLIIITVLCVIGLNRLMKNRAFINLGAGREKPISYDLGRYQILASGFCALVIGLAVMVPIASLIRDAGALANYTRALSTSADQIVYSMVLATLGGLATVSLAFPISYMIERSGEKHSGILELASLIPFAVPAITLGIGMIKVWNRTGIDVIYTSSVIIMLGFVARYIPFAVRLASAGLKQISPGLEESARMSTGSWARVMRKIVLPLCSPSLMAGFFITFVLSLGELGTTLLVIPPGRESISLKIYNLMHYGAEQMVAALALILVGLIFFCSAIFLLGYKLVQRWLNAQN